MNRIASVLTFLTSPIRWVIRLYDPTAIEPDPKREEALRGLRGDIEKQKIYLEEASDELRELLPKDTTTTPAVPKPDPEKEEALRRLGERIKEQRKDLDDELDGLEELLNEDRETCGET